MRATTDYIAAQRKAAVAQKVAQAVQAAARSATMGVDAAGLGMLKLRQLVLNGNSLSGSLPAKYAHMIDLQVGSTSGQQQLMSRCKSLSACQTCCLLLLSRVCSCIVS